MVRHMLRTLRCCMVRMLRDMLRTWQCVLRIVRPMLRMLLRVLRMLCHM